MLKFVNKEGKVVAEMKDSGDMKVLVEDAKLASLKDAVEKKAEDK